MVKPEKNGIESFGKLQLQPEKVLKKREVKVIDYCIHIDDPVTVLTVADKSGNISKFTSHLLSYFTSCIFRSDKSSNDY